MTTFKSLADLRKGTSLKNVQETLEKMNSKGFEKDERYWSLSVDKNGNGKATIRFLPPSDSEAPPMVRLWTHSFKGGNGRWYIQNSLTTIGKDDPVYEANAELYEQNTEESKKLASSRKRRLNFIANILVIDDPENPQNNGTVRLFKFGPQILDLLKKAADPASFRDDDDDDSPLPDPIDPFDVFEGAPLILRAKNKNGMRNYESSKMGPAGPLADSEAEIEKIWRSQHDLQDEISEKNFKSYDELKKIFDGVVGNQTKASRQRSEDADELPSAKRVNKPKETAVKRPSFDDDVEDDSEDDEVPFPVNRGKKATVQDDDEDSEDLEAYFKGLSKK